MDLIIKRVKEFPLSQTCLFCFDLVLKLTGEWKMLQWQENSLYLRIIWYCRRLAICIWIGGKIRLDRGFDSAHEWFFSYPREEMNLAANPKGIKNFGTIYQILTGMNSFCKRKHVQLIAEWLGISEKKLSSLVLVTKCYQLQTVGNLSGACPIWESWCVVWNSEPY